MGRKTAHTRCIPYRRGTTIDYSNRTSLAVQDSENRRNDRNLCVDVKCNRKQIRITIKI